MITAGRTGRVGVGASGSKVRDMSGIDGGLEGASSELVVVDGKSGIKETSKEGLRAGDTSLLVVLGGESG